MDSTLAQILTDLMQATQANVKLEQQVTELTKERDALQAEKRACKDSVKES